LIFGHSVRYRTSIPGKWI